MDQQVLNEKIAFWLGFNKFPEPEWIQNDRRWARYSTPDGYKASLLPPFTSSMNTCIKWILPKLSQLKIYEYDVLSFIAPTKTNNRYYCNLEGYYGKFRRNYRILESADSMSLAFCLVVEKLIDSEDKNA